LLELLPLPIFIIFSVITFALVLVGIGKKIPMLIFTGAIFLLTWVVLIDSIDMGGRIMQTDMTVAGVPAVTTTIYSYEPDEFLFTDMTKTLFGFLSAVIFMLGYMIYREVF